MPTVPPRASIWTRCPFAFHLAHPCPFFASSRFSWKSSLVAFVAPRVWVVAAFFNVLLQLVKRKGFGHLVDLPAVATRFTHSCLKEALQLHVFKHQIPCRQAAVVVVDL